jgi:hypothetical protein
VPPRWMPTLPHCPTDHGTIAADLRAASFPAPAVRSFAELTRLDCLTAGVHG